MLLVAFSRRMCCSRALQREPVRGAAGRVDRHADETPGQRALVVVPGREERRVRTTEPERDTEPLRRADHDVRAELAGWRHERQGEQIDRERDEGLLRVGALDERAMVADRAAAPRVLQQQAEHAVDGHVVVRIADGDRDAEGFGTRAHDFDRLRVAVGIDEETVARVRVEAMQHRHGFGGRRAFVEQRRVREVHRGEVCDHRLEVEQRFEPAL